MKSELRLVKKNTPEQNSIISIGEKGRIGEGHVVVIAGPCAVESYDQFFQIASHLKKIGISILRGGAFKGRTSPHSFQGLATEGLLIIKEVKKKLDLLVATEVLDVRDIDKTCECADIVQVGSRNMQNYSLLKELGKIDRPILLKRGMMATLEEWLQAAEYIYNEGNPNIILCERGIRTFETSTRNTLDISAIPIVKRISHLPVIVDPSHSSGRRELILPLSMASLAAGADGLIIETHNSPENALSDGFQAVPLDEMNSIMENIRDISTYLKKNLEVTGIEPATSSLQSWRSPN